MDIVCGPSTANASCCGLRGVGARHCVNLPLRCRLRHGSTRLVHRQISRDICRLRLVARDIDTMCFGRELVKTRVFVTLVPQIRQAHARRTAGELFASTSAANLRFTCHGGRWEVQRRASAAFRRRIYIADRTWWDQRRIALGLILILIPLGTGRNVWCRHIGRMRSGSRGARNCRIVLVSQVCFSAYCYAAE